MSAIEPYAIRRVLIYKGHGANLSGPYPDNVTKQTDMFHLLNRYRVEDGRPPWTVTSVTGENLITELNKNNPQETLLVIPAGPSSHLDKVFSAAQTTFIKSEFLARQGGRLYATCGSSYMMSAIREYNGMTTNSTKELKLSITPSSLSLFEGIAKGPLCSYPDKEYNTAFYSDAVTVAHKKNPQNHCTIYLSGGGSFFPYKGSQKVKILARYIHSELIRIGKTPEESNDWANAAILAKVGRGAIVLSMVHPENGPEDMEIAAQAFPHSSTNWTAVKNNLSSLDSRMRFVLNTMLYPLEKRTPN